MKVGLTLPHSETRVEEEDPLVSPASQVPMPRSSEAGDVSLQFLEDVDQTVEDAEA